MSEHPCHCQHTTHAIQHRPANGLGVAGMVLGIVSATFALSPVTGAAFWPAAVVGIVLSGIGVHRVREKQATNKNAAVAGLVLSIVALVLCLIWFATTSIDGSFW